MSVFALPSLPPDCRRRQRRWKRAAAGFTYGNSLIHSQTQNSRGLPSRIRVNQRIDYIHLGGKLVAQRSRPISSSTATTTYHHTDSIQSANVETNTAGTQTQRTVRMPYGSPYDGVYREGPGFAGHVTDTQTNLTYMQQRYYDPVALRFLSPDPVDVNPTNGSNFNRYWYANNNPYRFVDPDGREAGFTYHRDGRMTNYLTENEPDWATAGALTISVIPIIGDAVAIGEAIASPTAANIMAAAVGVLPVVGVPLVPSSRRVAKLLVLRRVQQHWQPRRVVTA